MGSPSTKKFFKNNAGVTTEEAALLTSAGSGDANKIPALNASGVLDATIVNSVLTSAGAGSSGQLPALNGSGTLDPSFMPTGIGADVVTITTSEAISAGAFVNIWVSSGTKVRNADATTSGKQAHGFVLAGASSGGSASVYLSGLNTGVTGQTVGNVFLLAGGTGLAGATAPSASGNLVQGLGVAVSATAIQFAPISPVVLA